VLRRLFGRSKQIPGQASSRQVDPDELLRRATALKRDGDLDAAIEMLRAAYAEIAKGQTIYTVDTYLRLPMYLQATGKTDEAWAEFNRLLAEGYANQILDFDIVTMEHSKIYDKMRLFLQRENRNEDAVVHGILSFLAWARGLHLQHRDDEFAEYTCDDSIEASIGPLLRKADRVQFEPQVIQVVKSALNSPTRIDFEQVSKGVRQAMTDSGSA